MCVCVCVHDHLQFNDFFISSRFPLRTMWNTNETLICCCCSCIINVFNNNILQYCIEAELDAPKLELPTAKARYHCTGETINVHPQRVEFKLAVLFWICLQRTILRRPSDEFHQSSDDKARLRFFLPRHHPVSSDAPAFQPSATEYFLSLHGSRLRQCRHQLLLRNVWRLSIQ